VGATRVNSLPSPWSRALQFEQAVRNSRYPTREALLEELFGCFATIALWEIYGVKLEAERVALEDFGGIQDEAIGPFARSLRGTVPANLDNSLYRQADGGNPWEIVHVLKVNGLVVGFTSPATLLCPTVHLARPIPGMNWTAGGRFAAPTPFLGQPHRQALADWLSHVRRGILTAPDRHSQTMASQLADVIDGFIDALTGGALGNPQLSDNRVPNLPPRPVALSLLARAAKGGISESLATLQLGDRQRRPLPDSPRLPVVLLDDQMPHRLGMAANEITLHKASTLESVGFDKARLELLYGGEIEVLTPDDIFLSELHLLPGGGALVNSWLANRLEGQPLVNGQPVSPLLPLRERMRELFSSAELSDACSLRLIQAGGGQQIEVTLLLPIKGARDPYPISRCYPIKEENLLDDDLPVITLWPNISDAHWSLFYIFSEDSATGLSVDGFSDYDRHMGREGQQAVKYFSTKRFPDLVKLVERGQLRGMIPVHPPLAAEHQSAPWRVGIDFGTSFTNFYIDDGSGPARKSLETRLIPLTLAQKENQLNLLYQYFIPEVLLPKGTNPPTSTAINLYGWQEIKGTVPKLFHEARVQWPSANAFAFRGAGIRTGFKWRQLQYQKPFLQELALLISANAAAAGARQIEWSVSYPSAFSPNEARQYRRLWIDLCTELTSLTGLRHQIFQDGGNGGLQTEAVAFASYFGNYRNRQLVHTSCLDVGGGTTDLSIWQENSLLHQVSLPFAGHDLCTDILQGKPSFIRFLFAPSTTGEISDNDAKLRQDRNFHSWVDNCLRYESDELLSDRLPIFRSEQQPQLLEFISLMAVGFGGLYHYLGLILRALDQAGVITSRVPTPVYLGGNGARFLNWLDPSGVFSRGCDSDQLLEALQCKSAGFNEAIDGAASTTLSDAYKDETACGLISLGKNLRGDFDPRDELMFAGEAMQINDQRFGPLDRVAVASEASVVDTYALTSLDQVRQFVANYDEAISSLRIASLLPIRKLARSDTLWSEVETEVRNLCLQRVGKEVAELEPEPGFMLGLKALIHTLAQQWADRY
jgi:hypothetical protein